MPEPRINHRDTVLGQKAHFPPAGPDQSGAENPLKRAAFCGPKPWLERVYGRGRWEKIAALTALYPHVVDLANFEEHLPSMREVEVIFSTWGFPRFTHSHLDHMRSLQAVFYAAGTVQPFAQQYLTRDIAVVSAWQANAIPVAEFTLAQILLSTKGYFRNVHEMSLHRKGGCYQGPGNFGDKVAILGAGAIGTRVIELLQPFELSVIVYDPFLTADRAERLGVRRVSLEAAFEEGLVVSNHIANVPETRKLLRGDLFKRMRTGATFINTGRGETVDEPAMIDALKERPDVTALLDVTHPEPAPPDSPLYEMPNVSLSSHIAGSINDEVVRMADYCIEDFIAFSNGRPLRYAVSMAMLETMA